MAGWSIVISCSDGSGTTVVTDANGNWSFSTPLHDPTAGTTTCTVSEVQQPEWTQTGNTVDQSIAAGAVVTLNANKTYTVVLPNDAPATADQLLFGNECIYELGPEH